MSIFNKKKICVTHNGAFHADDLFATATLSILNNGNIKIIRTRDQEIFKKADYLYDVGGENDFERDRFDHHQRGGAGVRENGVPYSSFGLIWKKYGEQICGSKEVSDYIESKIVLSIDATDNGLDISTPKIKGVGSYSAPSIFLAFYPTWKESTLNVDKIFKEEVEKIVPLLKREIVVARADIEGKGIVVKSYEESSDKRIIIIESPLPRYLIQSILSGYSDPVYFIYPSGHDDSWKVEAIRKDITTMESRKLFPESWRGLMNGSQELRINTGVPDILFCHQSGFFLHVKSKEGAIALAQKALIS